MKKLYSVIIFLSLGIAANAQSAKDTSAAFRLIRNNEVIIGIYDSPNLTFVKPVIANDGGFFPGNGAITSYSAPGYNRSITAKLKFREGLFLGTGFSFSMQSYLLSQIGGSDSLPSHNANSFGQNFNDDQYTCTFKNYYASIPLTFGYSFTHEGWSNYIDIGVEFYYNYMNSESMEDNTKGDLLQQATFYHGTTNWYWLYSPFGLINYNWSTLGVFGVLNAGLSYHITPKFSAAFESTLRFTNPFVSDPVTESFSSIRGLANLSLNLGLTYSFQIEDIGSFKTIDNNNDSKDLMVGFNIIPNYFIYPLSIPFNIRNGFSFSYDFSAQFKLSNSFALETGIVLDNFTDDDINTVYIGIPALLKYYFPHIAGHNTFYIGVGCHFDYHTNIGLTFYNPYRFILPIPLIEIGYEVPIANKYCFNTIFGYGHEFKYIALSDNVIPSGPLSQLPHIFYSSIGFSYKFK